MGFLHWNSVSVCVDRRCRGRLLRCDVSVSLPHNPGDYVLVHGYQLHLLVHVNAEVLQPRLLLVHSLSPASLRYESQELVDLYADWLFWRHIHHFPDDLHYIRGNRFLHQY